MKRAIYICIEGTEGVGKTTQTQRLTDHLRSKGYRVLQTKEPGTSLAPLTMVLRGIMLDKQYDEQLTAPAREFISQAIRSIHFDKVIIPALTQYDYIVQDRGILSGFAYGTACGNSLNDLKLLTQYISVGARQHLGSAIYDRIIYLKGDISTGLRRALTSKQEFKTGDAMESRGNTFLNTVAANMDEMSTLFNTTVINIDDKTIDSVLSEILRVLNVKE